MKRQIKLTAIAAIVGLFFTTSFTSCKDDCVKCGIPGFKVKYCVGETVDGFEVTQEFIDDQKAGGFCD